MKNLKTFEEFLNESTINESFSDKAKNYAIGMAKDSNIQRSARGLIDAIVGKPIDDAFSFLNKKLDSAINVPLEDWDNNHGRIRNREEAREVFTDYMAKSSIERTSAEENEEVPISPKKFLKKKIKTIYSTMMSWLEESDENSNEYELIDVKK